MTMLRPSPRWLLGLTIAAGLVVTYWSWNISNGQAKDDVGKPAESPLPIRQVVLFNSGVGYFQREGEVEGNARIDLSFPTSEINDLLKSMVLQDLSGGKISSVNYDSHDPIDKILRGFALDLTTNPTFSQILNQARGEKIEITRTEKAEKQETKHSKLTGTIVGMEARNSLGAGALALTGFGLEDVELLNLATASGLQSIPLNQVTAVRFLNPTLENEFQRALEVLARSHDVQKKTVTLGFDGAGKRAVRVGYVVEKPIWRTSYRLRVEAGGKITLQGWALIENTSDEDWKDVRLVLVSGKPISYKMNLYEPLYMPRPVVESDLYATLRPPVYAGVMDGKEGPPPVQAMNLGGGFNLGGGGFNLGGGGFNFGGGLNLGGGGFNLGGGGFNLGGGLNLGGDGLNRFQRDEINKLQRERLGRGEEGKLQFDELQKRREAMLQAVEEAKKKGAAVAGLNFKEGIDAVATGAEAGDYYQFALDQKISLARQKSAMLPILDHSIEGSKVSIFNATVHARHPLLGLKIKNTSGQPLTQGPITVYDQSTYAGDSRILSLQPKEERLLSYALDQTTEIKRGVKKSASPDMNFKIDDTKLAARYTMRETTTYAIKNRSAQERTVILEHAIRPDWKLINEGKIEKTRGHYRFVVAVPAGALVQFEVNEEQPHVDHVAFSKAGDQPSYAQVLGIDVKSVVGHSEEKLIGLKIAKGSLLPVYRQRQSLSYFVQNLSDMNRTFTVDHIIAPYWVRVGEDGKLDVPNQGPSVYRFVLPVEKGKTGVKKIEEERHQERKIAFKDLGETQMREFLANPSISAEVKKALTNAQTLAKTWEVARNDLSALELLLTRKNKDQDRLRENLKIIPMGSEHYKKFLDRFVIQEGEIETMQAQITAAQVVVTRREEEYRQAILMMNAE